MNSTYPSTIWDKSSASYARARKEFRVRPEPEQNHHNCTGIGYKNKNIEEVQFHHLVKNYNISPNQTDLDLEFDSLDVIQKKK